METLLNAPDATLKGAPIKDSDTANFKADVIDASMEVPVIVDFWATWCGPCKQLGPTLEKVVSAARGAVRLVKVDVDANPELSAQLRVQSIPAVFAFHQGRPVDAFQGALPESQVKAWVDQLVRRFSDQVSSPIDDALAAAQDAMEGGDTGSAGALYGQVLTREPANTKAVAGLARCHLQSGRPEKARALLDGLPEDVAKDGDIQSVRSAVELAEAGTATAGQLDELQAKVAADASDLQARYELAVALFGAGQASQSIEELLALMSRNKDWNEQAARKELLKIFDSLGVTNPLAIDARRRLSSILFS